MEGGHQSMSRSIDEKVVELKFDNKQFESGVKTSLGTLDKLKEAVTKNISSKSLEGVSKAAKDIDVSNAIKGIEALQDRFSTLGIVGMRVIQNITDGLMNGMSRGIHAVTDSIISGGYKRAMNIENARFQLQGILSDASEVQAVMDQASESVDGTAYAFDSAAKAASMFTASGIESGDQLMHALRGLAGATATFNADYESMSMIWTKISGQGRVMGDELNQLSNKGMNAAASISQYFNAVNDGSMEASEEVQDAIKRLSKGMEVTEGDIREFVTAGEISFSIFSEAMSRTFGEHAKDANKTFTGALANIRAALARTGEGIFAPLIRQEGPMVNLFNAIRVKVNDFNKAFKATNGIVDRFTKFAEAVINKLTAWIENLKIANTWVQKFGDGTTKTFADAYHKMNRMADGSMKVMKGTFYTPFTAFQDIVFSIANIFKALASVMSPIAKAFKNVFAFDSTGVYKGIEAFRKFTESLILSEKQAEKLQKLFTGIFKVIASVVRIFTRLISSIRGVEAPSINVADNFFDLAENVGNALEEFANFIDESPEITKALELIGNAVKVVKDVIGGAIDFIINGYHSFDPNAFLAKISKSFDSLRQSIFDALPDWAQKYLLQLQDILGKLAEDFAILDFSAISADFRSLGDVFADFGNVILKLSEWKDKFVAFFDFSNEESGINKFIAKGNEFVAWFQRTILPAFSDVSVAGAVGTGGLMYVLYTVGQLLLGLAKIMKGGGATLTELPKTLKSLRKALNAYTADVKTDALKKVAESILMIAGAIFILALIKPERLIPAAVVLGVIAVILVAALHEFNSVPKEATTLATVMNTAAKGLQSAFKNFGKAIKMKAFSNAILKFVIAIGIIIAEILAVRELWAEGPEAFKNAAKIVAIIGGALLGMAVIMSLLGQKLGNGMRAFSAAGIGVLAMSLAIGVMIWAFKSIMDLKLPDDYQDKINILIGICAGIGVLMLAFGLASRIAAAQSSFQISNQGLSKQSWNKGIGTMPLLGMVAMIIASVWAVKQLMEMTLPGDWKKKIAILAGIFVALGALILVVGKANQMAGGKGLKAFGTIVGMCLFIGVAIAALKILSDFNGAKIRKGMIALAGILFMLSFTLKAAGSIQKGAGGTVLAMAVTVIAIVLALSVLSMFSPQALAKGAVALGGVLLVLAAVFAAIGKINNGNAWKPVLAMVVMVAAITIALMFLATTNWPNLLAGAAALSGVLLALTYAFKKISGSSTDPKKMLKKVGTFLLLGVALYEIMIPLAVLATFPWANILAAGAAISAVLLAYTKAFESVKGANVDMKQIGSFLLGCISVCIIGGILWLLADRDWKGMLAGAAGISLCLVALAGTFKILSTIPNISGETIMAVLIGALGCALIGAALMLAAQQPWQQTLGAAGAISACLIAIGIAFGIMGATANIANLGPAIAEFAAGVIGIAGIGYIVAQVAQAADWQQLLGAGISISIVLLSLALAMAVCAAVGTVAGPALAGIGILDAFIADLVLVITALGALREIPHFDELFGAGSEMLVNIGKVIGDFAGSIIEGIGAGIGRGLEAIGTSLSNFMINASVFFMGLKMFDDDMVQGAKALAGVVLAITAAEFISGLSDLFSFFTGGLFGNSDGFGEKLKSFGSALKDFYDSTQGIDKPYHFKAVAEGAQYLVELSKSLPNSGGLLGEVMGNNDMDKWGKQLVVMGIKLSEFAIVTAGITESHYAKFKMFAENVQPLIDMSKDLPNSGGLLGEIMGNNDMDAWGEQLVVMGRKVTQFALAITPISDAVYGKFQSFATGVSVLVELSKSLPNSGGFLGSILGDNDMDTWGSQLAILGQHVAEFASYMVDVSPGTLANLGTALQNLVTAINSITVTNPHAVESFGTALGKLAQDGLKVFITTFSSQGPIAVAKVNEFVKDILAAINNVSSEFNTAGIESATKYLNGISSKYAMALTVGRRLGTIVIEALKALYTTFRSVGAESANQYGQGILSSTSKVADMAKQLAFAAYSAMNPVDEDGVSLFYKAGKNAGEGYVKGVESQLSAVKAAAAEMASAAGGATAKEQESRSPAKKFIKLGSYAGEGYVIGILRWAQDAFNAGKELAKASNLAIDESEFSEPVIRPIVDLTNVISATDTISSLFATAMTATMNKTNVAASGVNARVGNIVGEEIQNGEGSTGNTYNFNQYNNSPKALSRIEIYRDTKNLMKQYREAVESV